MWNEWTVESVVIALSVALAGALIGGLVSALVYGRQQARLYMRLDECERLQTQVEQEQQALQARYQNTSDDLHALQIQSGKYEEQLDYVRANEHRIAAEKNELKAEIAGVRERLDESRQLQHQSDRRAESVQAENLSLNTRIGELKQQLSKIQASNEALQEKHAELAQEYTRLKVESDERMASHAQIVESFEKQKSAITEQFKLLSNDILDAKTRSLQESNRQGLSAVMAPFQQSIDSFKREVQEIHHRETTQQGELRKELESLKELNRKITAEAHELSTALRGQKKLQGNWGELVLENVLDRSGLQAGKDYQREVSITTEEGKQRPDVVVYLPQDKHLIIDAKVSLNAYTRYVNSEDDGERAVALKEHVQAVASRIKELADRDYYKLPGLNSPEMVFMFIPIESAFVEALKADEQLFQQAIENNVLVATPTTLLTSLNIVRQLWRYEDQNKHTAALAGKAEAVFKKLNSFLGSFEQIKKGLDRAGEAYTRAENQLVSGKGNLVKQVGEFKNLAPAIRAELPEYFAEKAALEIDFIPVQADLAENAET